MAEVILKKFKTNLINFLQDLIDQFPEEGDLIMIRIFIDNQIPIENVMTVFIQKLLPLKDIVAKRDANFFLGNQAMSLFDRFDKTKVNYFKTLWQSSRLDDDDRNKIWKWYDLFIILAEAYQKRKNS